MVSLASISDYLNVWKYESSNLEPVSSFRSTTGHCSCLAWNHTNQVVATGGNNHQIHLIQANNGNILSSLQVSEDLDVNSKTNAIALSSTSRFLAAAISNKIQLWDLKRRQLKTTLLGHQADVTSLCFLPTGEAISGDIGGTIRIWDSKAYIPSPAMTMTSGTLSVAGVTSLSISPTGGSALAAGYSDGVLGIWDSTTYQLLRRQVFHSGSLNALAFSPRNPRLVTTAGSDGKVTLIDTGAKNSTDPSALIDLSGVSATAVTFHEDAIHTAIGLSNGKILIYDWRNLRKPVVATPERAAYPILALSFQVPKTSASGGDSVASRQSRPATTPTRPSALPPAPAAAPAPAQQPTSARTAATAQAVDTAAVASRPAPPVTDVPIRAAPSTPSRVAQPQVSSQGSLEDRPSRSSLTSVEGTAAAESPASSLHRTNIPPRDSSAHIPPAVPQLPTQQSLSTPVKAALWEPSRDASAVNRTADYTTAAAQPDAPPLRSAAKAPTPQSAARYARWDAPETSFEFSAAQGANRHVERSTIPAAQLYSKLDSLPAPPAASSSSAYKVPPHGPVQDTADAADDSFHAHSRSQSAAASASVTAAVAMHDQSFDSVRQAVKPVTAQDLDEALMLLRYDLHREMQDIIREQIRQFSIAKDETAALLKESNAQVDALLRANQELRAENERLRRIY